MKRFGWVMLSPIAACTQPSAPRPVTSAAPAPSPSVVASASASAKPPPRREIYVHVGKVEKKLSTKAWRKPPMSDPNQPSGGSIAAGFCIVTAHRVPESNRVLLELRHICLGGGDWCSPGGPTFHVVGD